MHGRLIPLRTDNIDNVAASDINTLEDFLRGLVNGDYAFHVLKIEGYGTDWVSLLPALKSFYDARGSAQGPVVTDSNNKIPTSQLPALAIIETYAVSTESAQLALDVQKGDICVRTDLQQSFIALNGDNASMDDWQLLQSPTDAVQSVDGRTGTVVLSDLYEAKNANIQNHIATETGNPHAVTHAELSDKGVNDHTAIDNFIASKGEASGLASLDSMGIIESSQLPSFAPAAVATPVGSIVAVIAGYFGDGNNGSFTAVSLSVSDNWQYCDGSEFYDADSPIYNATGRYLPNLTDSRFIMGSTTAGTAGGNNNIVATIPAHKHGRGNLNITSSGSHYHYVNVALKHTGQMVVDDWYRSWGAGKSAIANMDTSCTRLESRSYTSYHTHDSSDFSGYVGNTSGVSGDSAITVSAASGANLPSYLTAKYYKRVK